MYRVERWDPHTGREREALPSDRYLAILFQDALGELGVNRFMMTYHTYDPPCVNPKNLQTILERSEVPECELLRELEPGGLCTLWSLLFFVFRLYNKDTGADISTMTESLEKWATDDPGGLCEWARLLVGDIVASVPNVEGSRIIPDFGQAAPIVKPPVRRPPAKVRVPPARPRPQRVLRPKRVKIARKPVKRKVKRKIPNKRRVKRKRAPVKRPRAKVVRKKVVRKNRKILAKRRVKRRR